jgi:hypothetical protein
MKAIHNGSGMVVEIQEAFKNTFRGKVIFDPARFWKEGTIIKRFEKEQFSIILSWEQADRLKSTFEAIKTFLP